ncbi:DinB family protein [Cytobacillus oceanisediminis]|uniref:DinB family protein n=1 Tax=Cytobacillus oceanisediminis TaxID=665099 RepID=UPI003735B453
MEHPALKMYDYHVWANNIIIDRLMELPDEIYHKEIQSGFSSVSKVLSHIYATDCVWFDIISGKSMKHALASAGQLGEQAEIKNITEMKKLFLDLSERYKAFLNSQEDIEKMIAVDNPYAGVLETSISESLLHVATHGAYHRGNIATMLRQMGHTSAMQDYGLYLYSR